MTQMIYKNGGETLVWGKKATVMVIKEDELESYLKDGWLDHPSKLDSEPYPLINKSDDEPIDKGEVSDGYHTFNELYAHRVRLFSTLMRAFSSQAWWSFCHSDGEQWDGWIIAGIETPEGAATYHLPESEIPYLPEGTEIEFGKEWDGHTPEDVLSRLLSLKLPEPTQETEQKKKPGPKPKKANSDESDNEG